MPSDGPDTWKPKDRNNQLRLLCSSAYQSGSRTLGLLPWPCCYTPRLSALCPYISSGVRNPVTGPRYNGAAPFPRSRRAAMDADRRDAPASSSCLLPDALTLADLLA